MEDRRRIIKQLLLAGFGIHLIGCSSPAEETVLSDLPTTDDVDSTQIDSVVDEIIESHVTYFKKTDESFDKLAECFNLLTVQTPFIIALPENTEGVAKAIKYANELNLPVAIKSGGHSFEGFSSNEGGMVINLSLLKSKEWNETEITVGPGLILKELYDETLPKGRILPAGSCGTVGVGGLTLGGGYGFFSRKYGLTCDHLIKATLVDGNGEIHELNEGSPALWALKGGGNGNFGVVTSMTFKTHEIPKHFTYNRFKAYKLDVERAKSLLSTWFGVAQFLPASCFSAFVLNGKSLTILLTNYESVTDEVSEFIEALTEITDKQSSAKYTDIGKHLENYYGVQHPIYFKNASAGYYNDFSDIENCIDAVLEKVTSTPGLIYQVNTLGGQINSEEFKKKSSYPHRSYNFLSELQSYWNEGQDQKRDNYLKEFEAIQSLFFENGNRDQYRNYPSIGFNHWKEAYYGENYERLQEFKQQFDPNDIFGYAQGVQLPE